MTLMAQYEAARRIEERSRLQRALCLRAMVASGESQRDIARALQVSQPAVSQQLKATRAVQAAAPHDLVAAAAPVLVARAEALGFRRLAVFGSVARTEATADSDVDLVVEPPEGAAVRDLLALKREFEEILLRPVDLVTYAALTPGLDDDILRDAVLL